MEKTTENLLKKAKELVMHNENELNKVDGDQSQAKNLHTIEIDGMEIWDVFSDDSMRFEVNPIDHYGQANIEKFVMTTPAN